MVFSSSRNPCPPHMKLPTTHRSQAQDFPETPDIHSSSDAYASRFTGEVGAWFLRVQEEATLGMLAPYPGATILDVGGGHGQLTGPLIRHGFHVTVLGSSESCKNRLQTLIDERRCGFTVGNILDLPYPARSFDVVVSYRLLPHVTQWKRLIAELTRVARTAVIIDYPTIRSVNMIAPWLFHMKKYFEGNTRPFTVFSESEIRNEFKDHYFLPVKRLAEFCLPMALYRLLKSQYIAAATEKFFRQIGVTELLGSPVIMQLEREIR
jgi:ubiquinone/menaquinone biosynthesis C-methylase UbiE